MANRMNEKRILQRWWVYGIGLLILSMVLVGCSSSNNSNAGNSKSSMDNFSNEASPESPASMEFNEIEAEDQRGDSIVQSDSKEEMDIATEEPTSGSDNNTSIGATASDLSAYDRKLIYNANVVLEVEDYGDAQTRLFNMVTLAGGYMLNFNDMMSEYESGGNFVIKVPSKGFHSFVNKLEELKKEDTKAQRNIQGKDVTEEYVDIASRLKAKQVVEGRLLSFMEKATDTKNLLQFSNELARVQEEIEAIKGRMRYIDQNVAFSTVEIRMYEKAGKALTVLAKKDNVLTRAGDAMAGSGKALLAMFEGIFIVLAGALPIIIVIGLIVAIIWVIYRKTRYNGTRQSIGKYETSIVNDQVDDEQADKEKN